MNSYDVITNNHRHNELFVRLRQIVMLLADSDFYKHKSYFPEAPKHKSTFNVFLEQLWQVLRYGSINTFYFPYGFDVKSRRDQKEYLHYRTFKQRRNKLNLGDPCNNSCILRDKLLFNVVSNGLGIRTAENMFLVNDGDFYDFKRKKHISLEFILKQYHDSAFFCKTVDGECGKGVFKLTIKEGNIIVDENRKTVNELIELFTSGKYLIQGMVKQHPLMSSLHKESVNTIRLVTVRDKRNNKIVVLPSILRIGTGKSHVDNTSQGGICVGIHLEDGRLKEYGFYKPQFGTKVISHPDSGIVFSDFVIPYFPEIKEQACHLHSMLPNIHSVGWDIALDEKGPVFIEGNDNWEINGPQICNGGLKKKINELFY